MTTHDGLKERLDTHRESTNPWAVIRELKLQLAARDAELKRLRAELKFYTPQSKALKGEQQ